VDADAAARAWIESWRRAWPARDPEAVAALYTPDAVYVSHPFREPHLGTAGVLDYARTAFGEEDLVEVSFGEPVASGDRAAVPYWAIVAAGGKELTLAGITMLHFAEDGRVRAHHECWAMDEGRRAPPPGWGV
jgi:ketosteroid isomerase-like protein